MSLPYYSKKLDIGGPKEAAILFYLPEIKKAIGHIISKNIGHIPPPHIESIISSYEFANHSVYLGKEGTKIWTKTIETYFKYIKLVVDQGKINELYQIYLISMEHLREGQEDLFYCEEQIESSKNKDPEIKLRLMLDKYHSLYEKNIRYSINIASYCLDLITTHKDIKSKSLDEYCVNDDLSYKIGKIENGITKCKLDLINRILLKGLDPHIKNAASHKGIEYGINGNLILKDRDWNKEFSLTELTRIVEEAEINFNAQGASIVLFAFEYFDKVDPKINKLYYSLKGLRSLIDAEIKNAYFIPKDINFIDDKYIVIDVEKIAGFDSTSELMGNIEGKRFYSQRPKLNTNDQALRIILYIAHFKTNFKECTVNVLDYNDKKIGIFRVNLEKWTKIIQTKYSFSDLEPYVIENNVQK
ncbi:MAG: hypothetical protein A2539_03570 [Elusimicrobia bacterium RIFOXYD2_FULL_34_15]|nr:MAG: hypothetical protein A2539_03570 [Elusimicrobia bacterium RIFOXYD2_FULL_34_15]